MLLLQAHVPPDQLQQAKRVLYGLNQGAPVAQLQLDAAALQAASARGFDLRSALFKAAGEQMRPPRIVRVGLVQNQVVLPTTAPYEEQAKVGRRCAMAMWVFQMRPMRLHASMLQFRAWG